MWIAIVYKADMDEMDWHVGQSEVEVGQWVIETRLPAHSVHQDMGVTVAAIAAVKAAGDLVLIEEITNPLTGMQYSVRLPDGYYRTPTVDLEDAYDTQRADNKKLRAAHSPELAVVVERAALYTEWKDVD